MKKPSSEYSHSPLRDQDRRRPVNKSTALVVAKAPKFTYEYSAVSGIARNGERWSSVPLSTKPFPGPEEHDLTGKVFGVFYVVGYFGNPRSAGGTVKRTGSQWVVRCRCGSHTIRSGKTLRKKNDDLCARCNDHRNIRADWLK